MKLHKSWISKLCTSKIPTLLFIIVIFPNLIMKQNRFTVKRVINLLGVCVCVKLFNPHMYVRKVPSIHECMHEIKNNIRVHNHKFSFSTIQFQLINYAHLWKHKFWKRKIATNSFLYIGNTSTHIHITSHTSKQIVFLFVSGIYVYRKRERRKKLNRKYCLQCTKLHTQNL